MKSMLVWVSAVLALVCSMFHTLAHAAPAAGEVQGEVQDSFGKPVAGVTLRLQTSDGREVGQTQSDPEGRFSFKEVAPGTYALLAEKPEYQVGTTIVTVTADAGASPTLTLAAKEASELEVATTRLNRARNGLSPETGSSTYRIDHQDIVTLPQGENTPVNQVLLQAPGVAKDSFGQLHVRGEHANLQFRLNGILLPEGISGFGQVLDTRFANRFNFLTGALPAQYGYRTAGVVDIQTKEGAFVNGGRVDFYGGSYGHVEPSVEFGGSQGKLNYYVTGSYLQNELGIEAPTSARRPIHDDTEQHKEFGYFSYLFNSSSRLSLIVGNAFGRFQIPNNPDQTPGFTVNGLADFDSAKLDENQRESNRYGILALQGSAGTQVDYQIALFSRYSAVLFEPDPIGDLIFNGVASNVKRSSFSNGLQGDGAYRLNEAHTLRTGLFFSLERAISNNTSAVFSTDADGVPTSDVPIIIVDDTSKKATLYGVYLQDEWRTTDKLTVNYGVRFDAVNAFVDANQVSPRLGAVYQFTKQTDIHAGYARYFTPPPTELVAPEDIALFQGTTNAPGNDLNSNVLPERSHYFDVGATHQVTPAFTLGIDGYYKIARDMLDEGQFGQALVFTPFNYRHGKVYGVELTGSYKKSDFSSYVNLALSKALGKEIVSSQFDFDPDELAFIADHYVHLDHDQSVTSSAGVAYIWQKTTFSVDGLYGSGLRRGFANTQKLPPNIQANLGVARGFEVRHLGTVGLRFVVLNLFDRVNELRDGSGIGVGAPQFATRRAFYGGVNVAF